MHFLYFDMGNVLLAFDHERMIQQMARVAEVGPEKMRQAVFPRGDATDPQWLLEAGLLSEDEYYDHLCGKLGCRPPRAELERAASDIFTPIEESKRLVERLAAVGHRLGLLSNTNAIHWRFCLERFPWFHEVFEVLLVSFELRAMKPDSAIYREAVERAGAPAHKVFFTDDREENIHGALDFGLDALRFTDAATLARELRSRGLEF